MVHPWIVHEGVVPGFGGFRVGWCYLLSPSMAIFSSLHKMDTIVITLRISLHWMVYNCSHPLGEPLQIHCSSPKSKHAP